MKRVKRRTVAVLVLIAMMVTGFGVYLVRYAIDGDSWAGFISNGNAFTGGRLKAGRIVDRNGVTLVSIEDGTYTYAQDETVRRATLHAVGDKNRNIGTGALWAFASELLGYNPITGIYSLNGDGGTLELTIDSTLNTVAYNALNGRSGTVAVMDYTTGEILCMVSTPSFDPENPPEISEDDTSGVYLNRFLSSSFTPGSTYKLLTLAAAIENIDGLFDRDFNCTGSMQVGADNVVCTSAHGDLKIEDALAVSCNCVFAQLALELGADTMAEYAEAYGLTGSFSVDGIATATGRYDKAEEGSIDLAWSGVGQYNDLVNPAAMLRFVGAIANSGRAVDMTQIDKFRLGNGSERIMSTSTAERISQMMDYCVAQTYGDDNFPGLELRAKSGTAEVGGGKDPNAWFVGFLEDEEHPLAFVVMIENGGWGSSQAGAVANQVLQAAVGS